MADKLYPGTAEAENERIKAQKRNAIKVEEPDCIGRAPNYQKFAGWDAERVLAWLNID